MEKRVVQMLYLLLGLLSFETIAEKTPLYYLRFPSGHGQKIVFEFNGYVWLQTGDGQAIRISKSKSENSRALISRDGDLIAYIAQTGSSREVFVYSHETNESFQLTFDGGTDTKLQGWVSNNEILYSKTIKSGKRGSLLFVVNVNDGKSRTIPLAEASEGCVLNDSFIFVKNQELIDGNRLYQGGYAQKIYKINVGIINKKPESTEFRNSEAFLVSGDYKGISRSPICMGERIFFLSDRDGRFNIWSMNSEGKNRVQHTFMKEYDIRSMSSSGDEVIYFQMRGELYHLEPITSAINKVDVNLPEMPINSMDEYEFKPTEATEIGVSDDGKTLVLVNRGKLWKVDIDTKIASCIECKSGVRVKSIDFSADGKIVAALHDDLGEYNIYVYGIEERSVKRIKHNIVEPIHDFFFSPDRKSLLIRTVSGNIYLSNVESQTSKLIDTISNKRPTGISWSKDSRYVTFVTYPDSGMGIVSVLDVECSHVSYFTSGRYEVASPIFNNRADKVYFLAKTNFRSAIDDTWGATNFWPSYDNKSLIYSVDISSISKKISQRGNSHISHEKGQKSIPCKMKNVNKSNHRQDLLLSKELPFVAGNYDRLFFSSGRLYAFSKRAERDKTGQIVRFSPGINGVRSAPQIVFSNPINAFYQSSNNRSLIIRTNSDVLLAKSSRKGSYGRPVIVTLKNALTMEIDLSQERAQMYDEIWRLYRDYFWNPNMNGVNWEKEYEKYRKFIPNVSNSSELGEVVNSLISELGAGHTSIGFSTLNVNLGDEQARIGAELKEGDGLSISNIFDGNLDIFEERSPLSLTSPPLEIGDRVTHLQGIEVFSRKEFYERLKGHVGLPVTLRIKKVDGTVLDSMVKPISIEHETWLRNRNWAYKNSILVDKLSDKKVGYIHLHSAFEADFSYFVREFSHLHERSSVILDLRGNNGGNIDAWVLHFLQRKAWLSVADRYSVSHQKYPVGSISGNLIVLIDGDTYSDGELIAEGIRRLNLGVLIGTRTSGAGRWVNDENTLIDGLKVRIPIAGSYVNEDKKPSYIIEGIGVTPDIYVENDPYEFYQGLDAQLKTAIRHALKTGK